MGAIGSESSTKGEQKISTNAKQKIFRAGKFSDESESFCFLVEIQENAALVAFSIENSEKQVMVASDLQLYLHPRALFFPLRRMNARTAVTN